MPPNPWKDWIPGVLSKKQMRILCESEHIANVPDTEKALDHSSIDLHLSDEAYEMIKGSVKPTGGRYTRVKSQGLAKVFTSGEEGLFTLQPKKSYLFKLQEKLQDLRGSKIHGQATAKSTIGRMDVLARLIVDGMNCYDTFDHDHLATGDMYLEITPITFRVNVKKGVSLSQLRFFYGSPGDVEIRAQELYDNVLSNDQEHDGSLSVDLSEAAVSGHPVSAFCATDMKDDDPPIDLWKLQPETRRPCPCKYWQFLRQDEDKHLRITKNKFYILRSKEKISLPSGVAVYCRAIDETIGEMRIHYAGFVHPFFGKKRQDEQSGTPLVFEVRGHDVDVCLNDGEKMAKLIFYRMSEDCEEEEGTPRPYNEQSLQLSEIFAKWPERIKVHEDGTVEPIEEESHAEPRSS